MNVTIFSFSKNHWLYLSHNSSANLLKLSVRLLYNYRLHFKLINLAFYTLQPASLLQAKAVLQFFLSFYIIKQQPVDDADHL